MRCVLRKAAPTARPSGPRPFDDDDPKTREARRRAAWRGRLRRAFPPLSRRDGGPGARRGRGARRRAQGRRHERRDRGLARHRPERDRAPRGGRDHLVQPRQGCQRDRVRRAAAREREHGRLRRRVHRRGRRQGDRDRAVHGRGSGGGPRGPGAPRARMAGPRPLSPVGPGRGNGDRAGRRDRSRGARRGPAHHEQRGRDGCAQRVGVCLRELERLRRRVSQFAPPHRLRGDRRGRRRHAARLLVQRRAGAGGPRHRRRGRAQGRRAHGAPARRASVGRRSNAR